MHITHAWHTFFCKRLTKFTSIFRARYASFYVLFKEQCYWPRMKKIRWRAKQKKLRRTIASGTPHHPLCLGFLETRRLAPLDVLYKTKLPKLFNEKPLLHFLGMVQLDYQATLFKFQASYTNISVDISINLLKNESTKKQNTLFKLLLWSLILNL